MTSPIEWCPFCDVSPVVGDGLTCGGRACLDALDIACDALDTVLNDAIDEALQLSEQREQAYLDEWEDRGYAPRRLT